FRCVLEPEYDLLSQTSRASRRNYGEKAVAYICFCDSSDDDAGCAVRTAAGGSAIPARVHRSEAHFGRGSQSYRQRRAPLRHDFRNGLRRRRRSAERICEERRLAPDRLPRKLYPDDELGQLDDERGVRSKAGPRAGHVEVRNRLDRRYATPEESSPDFH